MRCHCCNELTEDINDKKTDRFYCGICWEPTNQVILHNLDVELSELFGDTFDFELDLDVDDGDIQVEEFLYDEQE